MPDALGPIGLDPNQIRAQLGQQWQQAGEKNSMSAESFSQVMWHTVLKECLHFDLMGGGEGFAGSMYSDWAKEGFSSAIASQLARQNPLSFPGQTETSNPL